MPARRPRRQGTFAFKADGKGIKDIEDRSCTDVCSLCAFMLFWCGMLAIMGAALRTGDLKSLHLGTDYMGNRCGAGDYADRPDVFYPRLSQDLFEQSSLLHNDFSMFRLPAMYGLCLEECPTQLGAEIEDYGAPDWPVAGCRVSPLWWVGRMV